MSRRQQASRAGSPEIASASFLDGLNDHRPFAVQAIQVDGGSEFKVLF